MISFEAVSQENMWCCQLPPHVVGTAVLLRYFVLETLLSVIHVVVPSALVHQIRVLTPKV